VRKKEKSVVKPKIKSKKRIFFREFEISSKCRKSDLKIVQNAQRVKYRRFLIVEKKINFVTITISVGGLKKQKNDLKRLLNRGLFAKMD